MTDQTSIKLKYAVYSLFLVILVSYCSGSPKKAAVKDSGNIPHVYTVLINEMKFQPEQIEVNKGDTVIWKNKDMVSHDVTEFPDKKWTSGEIPSGGSWKMAITQSSDYYCSLHTVMKGKIVIK